MKAFIHMGRMEKRVFQLHTGEGHPKSGASTPDTVHKEQRQR